MLLKHFQNKMRCYGCIFQFPDSKICDIFLISIYFLRTKFSRTTKITVFQLCKFASPFFGKPCYKQHPYLSPKLYSHSCKHSPILCTKLRVSKNVSIRYNINDCILMQIIPCKTTLIQLEKDLHIRITKEKYLLRRSVVIEVIKELKLL